MQIKMIEGAADLVKFIDSIGTRGKKLDGDIHVAAVSAASHFAKHGDVTYINRLYLAMPKGARHAALTLWLTSYAGVSANVDKASQKNLPFVKDGSKKVDLTEGTKKPWFMLKPSKRPDEEVDVLKLVLSVIAKAKADGKQVVHAEMVQELEAIAEKYETTESAEADADPLAGVS